MTEPSSSGWQAPAQPEGSVYERRFGDQASSFIFLLGRDRMGDPADQLKSVASDLASLGDPSPQETSEALAAYFQEANGIFNRIINATLTIDYKMWVAGKKRSPMSLMLQAASKLFYAVKHRYVLDSGIVVPGEVDVVLETPLKKAFLRARISEDVGEGLALCTSHEERASFLSAVISEIEKQNPAPNGMPNNAPVFWLNRENRKETPPEFIRREYAPWLGHGLMQAHILHLDRPLYSALHKWLRSNPMPDWLDLPTKKQANDRQLESLGVSDRLASFQDMPETDLRERMRLSRAARRRFG